jgi:hypothetical protein
MKKENQNKSWRIIDEKIQTTKIKRFPDCKIEIARGELE